MLVSNLISTIWATMAIVSLLVKLFPPLDFIYIHGKGLAHRNRDQLKAVNSLQHIQPGFFLWISRLCVPKSNFSHMYVIGMFVCGILPLLLLNRSIDGDFKFNTNSTNAWLSTILFEIQVCRRLWECLTITEFGSSKVHLFAYLAGCFHYILAPITLSLSFYEGSSTSSSDRGLHSKQFFVIAVFLWASYYQYQHHRILFDLKLKSLKAAKGYLIPQTLGFNYVCCPHYSLEILIYIAFSCLHMPSLPCIMMNLWVVTNLCIVADSNHTFYLDYDRLGDKNPPSTKVQNWKRVIPFLW